MSCGDGCFHNFDYLYIHTRYSWPPRHSYFDIVDLRVFPSDTSLCASTRDKRATPGYPWLRDKCHRLKMKRFIVSWYLVASGIDCWVRVCSASLSSFQ